MYRWVFSSGDKPDMVNIDYYIKEFFLIIMITNFPHCS